MNQSPEKTIQFVKEFLADPTSKTLSEVRATAAKAANAADAAAAADFVAHDANAADAEAAAAAYCAIKMVLLYELELVNFCVVEQFKNRAWYWVKRYEEMIQQEG